MATIEITLETLDELMNNPEKIIAEVDDVYWKQLQADEDLSSTLLSALSATRRKRRLVERLVDEEDLSIVIRGNAGLIAPEDGLAFFREEYSQYFTAKYEECEGVNPWKAAVKDLFDFRTDSKRKLKRQGMIALAALWVTFYGYPKRPPTPKLGAAVGGAGEGFAYLDTYDICKKKEQFYYDLMNASVSVVEVTVHEVEQDLHCSL